MKISKTLLTLGQKAKQAARVLRLVKEEEKNRALLQIATVLRSQSSQILKANEKDLQRGNENGLSEVMLDRLSLQGRFESLLSDIHKVIDLPDPVGEVIEETQADSGLKLTKKRVPIGVLGVIYESRPNVTIDVAVLALKTGNAAILRGGSEALETNKALINALQKALLQAKLPKESVQLISKTSRLQVKQLLKMDRFVDMIIPRGGAGLHRFCLEESTIPVIVGGVGICHLFVDETVSFEKAIEVIVNAKTQRPSVCNALDTLLVHRKIAGRFLPALTSILQSKKVTFHLDEASWDLLQPKDPTTYLKASEQDWQTEWLSLVLNVKIVDSLEEAIEHIQCYSSGHSDGILTDDNAHAKTFVEAIDSAAVYVNASTRFTDGGQFGLGAEVAISTQKLHARGPMSLRELTTYKWIVQGNYHVRPN